MAGKPHHYDKIGWGFNGDNRFGAHKAFPIQFDSHMGTYGDSGCGTECRLDDTIFRNHFVKYINAHNKEIMLAIAESIKEEAKTLKQQAEKELNDKLAEIKKLEE